MDSEITREILLKLLRDFSKTCDSLGVTAILMHGGLIGWYWCRKLLPWDNDLDLCVRYDDLLKLNLAPNHDQLYDVRHYLLEVNPHHVRRETFNRHPFENRDPNKIDARFIHVPTGLFIDITALYPVGESDLITKCPHRYRAQDLFPLVKSEVNGISVHVPHQVDRVLEQEYGRHAISEPTYRDWHLNALAKQWERS
ncbi:LicD family protein [Luteolibacter pohnpeiensis]|nr:LicD family protein [Luteolibacter pohnpeiensis]